MWPVRCHRGDLGLAGSLREQLWAEAKVRFEGGQEWHLRDPELRDLERSEQDARFRSDPWEQTIATWLAKPSDLGDKTIRGVSTADVMAGALAMDVSKRDHASASRVGAILRRIGWLPSRHPETIDGVRIRLYRPEDGAGTNGHTLWPLEASGTVPLESDEPCDPGEDMFPPKDSLG
jgi:predicted P-loop ATPase